MLDRTSLDDLVPFLSQHPRGEPANPVVVVHHHDPDGGQATPGAILVRCSPDR
jgi:hypothetical protein